MICACCKKSEAMDDCHLCEKCGARADKFFEKDERHFTLEAVVNYADRIGYPNKSERDSFIALVEAVDLKLRYLERNQKPT